MGGLISGFRLPVLVRCGPRAGSWLVARFPAPLKDQAPAGLKDHGPPGLNGNGPPGRNGYGAAA
ncbi:hypothetical protein SAMN06272781_0994 [Streptomyces sp. 1222.2]|nr:hypothetical protein SAMN06272781_0994 [Streptomyces sp. 1222.2]